MANSPYSIAIGSRIRARRKSLEMNQDELGKALGVGQSSVAQYEAGNREINASDLVRLSEVLRVPFSYFCGEIIPYEQVSRPSELMEETLEPPTKPVVENRNVKNDHQRWGFQEAGNALDPDEQQLIDYYRRLSPVLKEAAIRMVSSWCDTQPRAHGGHGRPPEATNVTFALGE